MRVCIYLLVFISTIIPCGKPIEKTQHSFQVQVSAGTFVAVAAGVVGIVGDCLPAQDLFLY